MARRSAFTLVELLVVVGIIAILIGILIPVLRGARAAAMNVQCLSNLRSCGQVLHIYAQENKGYFPRMVWDTVENLPRRNTMVPASSGLPDEVREYPDIAEALYRIVTKKNDFYDNQFYGVANKKYSPGGMMIFYCPSNYFWDGDAHAPPNTILSSSHWPEDFPASGKIKYWYFGNPNPYYPRFHYPGPFGPKGEAPGTAPTGYLDWRFWDVNRNGDNRDEFLVKANDPKPSEKLLMTDQSRQLNSTNTNLFGLSFVHGKKAGVPISGWKNNLYGDGHVASRPPRTSSWSPDGKSFINPNPNPDELQPRWGNSNAPFMW